MFRISMLPTIIRENFGSRTLPREPEPSLVMDNQEQVDAYLEAGCIDGIMAASYLFHTARISQVIQGCQTVVDLGCGPATQLAQIAQLNPEIQFIGVELSAEMLEKAREQCALLNVKNISFIQSDMSNLKSLENASVDAVISTMALHHLPTLQHVKLTFQEIKRILKPQGALYLVDFGRFKSLKSVLYFAYMNAGNQPHIFTLDYERSLRAAFLAEEFSSLKAEIFGPDYDFIPTFFMPGLVLIKSKDKIAIPKDIAVKLQSMRAALPNRYRADLDDIRLLFRLNGLKADPFKI